MKGKEKFNILNEKTFIWIDEECFKKEEEKIKKFGYFKKLFSVEKFIFKICLFENKVSFVINRREINEFCKIYHYIIYYNEWGVFREKPIIFMELINNKTNIKSKKPFRINEIINYSENDEKIKLNIYFETVITGDPKKKSYMEKDNLLICYLGGLYCVMLNNKNWNLSNFNIEKIENNLNETYETALSLKINSNKWELFYY